MVDFSKINVNINKVITYSIFSIGIIASRLANDYEIKIALLKQGNEFKIEINNIKKDVEFLKEKIK